jgi:hypothetical protein
MSKLSNYADKKTATQIAQNSVYGSFAVENFMGGTSYEINPLDRLRIVAASSIFGEPQYYRDGLKAPSNLSTLSKYSIFSPMYKSDLTSVEIFENAIDSALDYDFKETLDLALELRNKFFMRLNPAFIFIRASQHSNRTGFNESNPGYMKNVGKSISLRPDDLTNQFEYYMYKNAGKKGLSSLVKRTWAEKLGEFSRYQLNKYKGKRLIDLVRISHAKGEDINELMSTGTLKLKETEKTWETLRSEGKTWKEITDTILIPHMALLRNLRGIFTEVEDRTITARILSQLKSGVESGKQFPFRYWSAFKAVQNSDIHHKQLVLDTLEECLDISVTNMPKLKGKTACLSDNSGSAWGSFNSEYGAVTVAEIANLSSLTTALQSDEGIVGVFGDNLSLKEVSKRNGILTQLEETSERGRQQGGGTENGIWIFWDEAIKNKVHYDNVFIYSDMQAGHGGLYGHSNTVGSSPYGHSGKGDVHVDVLAMVQEYRRTVNPKVNVFTVQVAGYNNTVLPENLYRGAILAGWTGKEPLFANAIIEAWDSIES